MITKRLLTLALLLPFLAMSTLAYAGAKASVPSENRNDVVHRYHGGPKYPH